MPRWWCAILTFLSHISVTCSSSHLTPSVIATTDRMYLESLALQGMQLSFDNTTAATKDWGQLRHLAPAAVVYPRGVEDVATIVQAVARSESDLTIAARGLGHSTNGQAQVPNSFIHLFIHSCYNHCALPWNWAALLLVFELADR